MANHDSPTSTVKNPAACARGLLGAVLEGWAGDCLRLRASGLDRPSWRTHTEGAGKPPGVRDSARDARHTTDAPARWAD